MMKSGNHETKPGPASHTERDSLDKIAQDLRKIIGKASSATSLEEDEHLAWTFIHRVLAIAAPEA